jgi:hypothetical protein
MNIDTWLLARENAAHCCGCASWANHDREVEDMNWAPVIWSIWGATILLMAAVKLYSSRLGKDEEDQVFLSDSSSHEQMEQVAIAIKVGKIEPLKKTALLLAGTMTIVVAVYYAIDMMRQFR